MATVPSGFPSQLLGRWLSIKGYLSVDEDLQWKIKDLTDSPPTGYTSIKFSGTTPYIWDGTTYVQLSGGGGVTDGNKGDITVASSGASWTINNNATTYAKIQQGTARSILAVAGNATANYAALQGTTDQILRVDGAGTSLGFGSIDLSKSASVGTSILSVANGGTGLATLTANKVLVGNGTSTPLMPTNFHWDNTNTRLGIGNASPQFTLDVTGVIRKQADANLILKPATSVNASYGLEFQRANSTPQIAAFTVNEGSGLISIGSQDANYFTRIRSGNADIINILTGGNIGIRSITTPTAYFHLPAGTASASSAPFKFTAGAILTTAESGVLETDGGNNLFYTNATAVRGRLQQNRTLTSAAGTLSVTDNYNHYVFTGSTSIWTLPSVSGTANVIYYIKNRGSGVLTINTTSGNEIYESAAVATINVSAGAALVLFSDGTYYNVE